MLQEMFKDLQVVFLESVASGLYSIPWNGVLLNWSGIILENESSGLFLWSRSERSNTTASAPRRPRHDDSAVVFSFLAFLIFPFSSLFFYV
jgi:hypothetical protein